jgi:dTDP-4-dehydrorhamnose reductase
VTGPLADRRGMATSLRVLITGEDMSLGPAFQGRFETAFDFVGAGLRCASRDDVSRVVGAYRPDVIFHGIDGHADDPAGDAGRARRADRVLGTRWMVEAADEFGARVVLLSSSAVFASTGSHARSEWEEPDAPGESAR